MSKAVTDDTFRNADHVMSDSCIPHLGLVNIMYAAQSTVLKDVLLKAAIEFYLEAEIPTFEMDGNSNVAYSQIYHLF